MVPFTRQRAREGFVYVELLLSVLIIAILLSLTLTASPDRPRSDTLSVALQMVSEIDRVIADASAGGGYAVLSFDAAGDRWAAWRTDVPPGVAPFSHALPGKVSFGVGNASFGPMGEAAASAVPLAVVVCDAYGVCDLGGAPYQTYYLQWASDGDYVAAVTITQSGAVESWSYRSEGKSWE